MKKLISLIFISLAAAFTAGAAESAVALLDSAASKLRTSKSITIACRVSDDTHFSNASLTISGKKFVIKSPEMEVWYDGKNQWAYSTRAREVTLTEPTPEELSQTNPLSMLEYFAANFNASMLPATRGMKNIRLTAKNSASNISTVDLSLKDTTLEPSIIKVKMDTGEQFIIMVTSIKQGNELPPSYFTYRKNLHPGADLIDLR